MRKQMKVKHYSGLNFDLLNVTILESKFFDEKHLPSFKYMDSGKYPGFKTVTYFDQTLCVCLFIYHCSVSKIRIDYIPG